MSADTVEEVLVERCDLGDLVDLAAAVAAVGDWDACCSVVGARLLVDGSGTCKRSSEVVDPWYRCICLPRRYLRLLDGDGNSYWCSAEQHWLCSYSKPRRKCDDLIQLNSVVLEAEKVSTTTMQASRVKATIARDDRR